MLETAASLCTVIRCVSDLNSAAVPRVHTGVAGLAESSAFVRHGSTIILHCPISPSPSALNWEKNMSRHGLHIMDSIVQDCDVKPEHRALYDVRPRPRCDLVIRNANKHHGGSYVCSDAHGDASEDVLLSVLGNSHKLVDKEAELYIAQKPHCRVGQFWRGNR